MEFKFVEFNARRAMRGAEAVRVLATYEDGTDDLLWMSKSDIGRNIIAFGRDPALVQAWDAYVAYEAGAR